MDGFFDDNRPIKNVTNPNLRNQIRIYKQTPIFLPGLINRIRSLAEATRIMLA